MAYPGSSGGVNYMKSVQEMIANTNAEISRMRHASLGGMIKAAALIRYQTEHVPPKTPKQYGNLISSWFVVTANSVPSGMSAKFTGAKAGKFAGEHSHAIAEKQAVAKNISYSGKQVLIMGYSANYAGFLHESLIAKNFTRKGSGIKWFETHFKNNRDRIFALIAGEIKKGK
jgi:hypothetical protein